MYGKLTLGKTPGICYIFWIAQVHIHLLPYMENKNCILHSNAFNLFTTRLETIFIITKYKAKCPFSSGAPKINRLECFPHVHFTVKRILKKFSSFRSSARCQWIPQWSKIGRVAFSWPQHCFIKDQFESIKGPFLAEICNVFQPFSPAITQKCWLCWTTDMQ